METYYQQMIESVLDQLITIKQLYYVNFVKIETDGTEKPSLLFDWIDPKAKQAYIMLTERLNYLVKKQHEVLIKENTHESK